MRMARKAGKTVSETLRQAILESGQTLYQVAKGSGVSYAVLHRFVVHQHGIALRAFDKLCAYLGFKLTK
jgi:Cro/C1-type HTH DNA-binding domain